MFHTIFAKDYLILQYKDQIVKCSRRRMRLTRFHDLSVLFPVGADVEVKSVYCNVADYSTVAVPLFTHPHDTWVKNNPMLESYPAKVVAVNRNPEDIHLLVELEPNVLAFAEVNDFDGAENVEFVPYKYNRKTKKIYGCVAS